MRCFFIIFAFALVANTANAAARSTHRDQVKASAMLDRVEATRAKLANRIDEADSLEVERLEALEDQLADAYWTLSKSLDGAWGMCDDACPSPAEVRANIAAGTTRIETLLKAVNAPVASLAVATR
jgi:hypothetical protein